MITFLKVCLPSFSQSKPKDDVYLHSWQVLVKILEDVVCKDMIIDVGMYGFALFTLFFLMPQARSS